jgi:hypothetical protein
MEINEQFKIPCEKWYIISNAVNSQETSKEFNKLYSPIQFIFLPSISSACNCLLGYSKNKIYSDIRAIYDFSLAYAPEYASI